VSRLLRTNTMILGNKCHTIASKYHHHSDEMSCLSRPNILTYWPNGVNVANKGHEYGEQLLGTYGTNAMTIANKCHN
jgi:hypothetical protein